MTRRGDARQLPARPRRPRMAIGGALLLGAVAPGPAAALTCYFVIDRNDNVVYRDTLPPVDLSDQGAAERERMRRRGEHMVSMESDRCPALEFFTGNAGSSALNVDQVVAGVAVKKGDSAGEAPPTADKPAAARSGSTRRR
jgi:hypothetical protein